MATETKPAPQTAPAPTAIERAAPVGELPSVQLDPTQGRVGFYSSLKPTDNTTRGRIYNAMVGNAKPLDEVMGEIILVENIVAMPIHLIDGITGEIKQAVRTVLIQPNGVMYGCVSEGIRKSIRQLATVFSEPPWVDGLEVRVQSAKAKVGRTYYLERPTDDEIAKFQKEQKELAAKNAAKNSK